MRKSFVETQTERMEYIKVSNLSKCLDTRLAKKTKHIKTLSIAMSFKSYIEQILKMSFAMKSSDVDEIIKVILIL